VHPLVGCLKYQITDIQGPVEDIDIAFRLFKPTSKAAFFHRRGDIRCGNWQKFDLTQPLDREGVRFMVDSYDAGYTLSSEYEKRISFAAILQYLPATGAST
jgi:hypothetical protein